MTRSLLSPRALLATALAASLVTLAACDQATDGNAAAPAQTAEAKDAAGNQTIAASLDQNGKFFAAAKAAGLDATLAGPGPYTVLAEDIAKAIDNGKGKAVLATMGGGTLTATKDGGKVVLTDSAGGKASVVNGDQRYSNGVVHHIDTVLMPSAS